jgi:hypothetical protein
MSPSVFAYNDYWHQEMQKQMRGGRYWPVSLPGCFIIVLLFLAIIGIALLQTFILR